MTNHEIITQKVVESEEIKTEDEEIKILEEDENSQSENDNEAKGFILPPPNSEDEPVLDDAKR